MKLIPPNLRDVSACCGNCDYEDFENCDGTFICKLYDVVIEHPAMLCDSWRNE